MASAEDELLAALADLIERADPPPESVRRSGLAAFSWRTVDVELAELSGESMTAGVRSASDERLLTFTGGGLQIEVSVSDGTLRGQIRPPTPETVSLFVDERHSASQPLGTRGDFTFELPPASRWALEVKQADPVEGATIRTPVQPI